ncbi:synphilin-1 [Caerostris darwini]|uniref:Synphilin-1 n=1 Tax=Caerostris darwini TaxID=1538125 RepID=A0AAV4SB02_9ARAC|nr:synphilin-1 [Caerostris darwini]
MLPFTFFCLSPTTISYLAQLKVQPVDSASMSSCNANGTLRVLSVWVSLGDLLEFCEKNKHKSNSWQSHKNTTSHGKYSSDCCLKNGLVQCRCLWSESNCSEWQKKSHASKTYRTDNLPYERKQTSWSHSNKFNGYFQDNKMLEEFILDDNELCLLNYYDIPLNVPKRHVRNSGKVKTVSIIDTLSELASGATDREDEGGFSSAVSESAVLNRYLHKPKARHARPLTSRRDYGLSSSNFASISSTTSNIPTNTYNISKNTTFNSSHKSGNDSLSSIYSPSLDDAGLPCSSLKRTLKCLRKAVASNVAEEEIRNRKHVKEKTNNEDAFRLCFSDSEIKDSPIDWTPKPYKLHNPKIKSKSLLAVSDPFAKSATKPSSIFQSRSKASVPDWIQEVFTASKKGNVDKMKSSLKDIDPALVRNLSDDHGNNLWHICAVYNNFECLDWLCSHNLHHAHALKDENKNGFSPAGLAVKHGSLLAVQWLIHNTISKSQLLPQSDSRSLLHIAARYGQYAIVEWLLNYMSAQNLDAAIVDSEGNTALHLAAKYGHINCVKALVFHIGNLKAKNEHCLKPLDLAVKHGKNDCADFLVALESCYNLASLNLRQHLDIQNLQKENTEMKNYFKELLTLTKRLQHRQKELVQSFSRVNLPTQYQSGSSDWSNDKNLRYLDDYSQLLATVMTDEEHRLLMVENKWKKSRKQTKHSDTKKKPLDVLRSQFHHIMDKVNSLSPPIPSTPESSDSSWNSDEEEIFEPEKPFPDLSPPDVVNSLFPETSVPYLDTKHKFQKELSIVDTNSKINQPDTKHNSQDTFAFKKSTALSTNNRDVNLRMFFKQNPNLRLSSETCSVLEVLEPSSSDGEECLVQKKKLASTFNSEKETEQSSSSSALETFGPCSRRPSSSGSKTSGSHSSSSGTKPNQFPSSLGTSQNDPNSSSIEKNKPSEETEHVSSGTGNKESNTQLMMDNNLSSEPDLIKGTQKKKMLSPFSYDKERKCSSDAVLTDNLNMSTDSESLEADRSFSSAVEPPDSLIASHSNPESSATGTAGKKKNFLLKFALRGRWQNKSSPRSLKNEISPEEFRETYSRSASGDNTPSTSQFVAISDCPIRKNYPLPKNDPENLSDANDKELTTSCERLHDCNPLFPIPSANDKINQNNLLGRTGLLPARRGPPPAPPLTVEDDDEQSQDHSDDDISISIQKSSVSSCVEGSSHNSFMNSRSPDLWHSADPKSHFRPASSASRIDSPLRGEENFPLNKSSSASTEMLSALDSSTAGRQSPAPSEVSKTESALSPPSDVSKTESTRYLSQLGKIEESGHLTAIKITNLQSSDEQNIKDSTLTTEAKVSSKHKKPKKVNSDKPWYEFSDEEDVIVPQRYKAVSVSIRSSSEDEGAITG